MDTQEPGTRQGSKPRRVGKARIVAIFVVAAIAMFGLGSIADAATSWNGSDNSVDYNNKQYIQTCDNESDSTKVKSKIDNNNSGSGSDAAKDTDGNNGQCATYNAGYSIFRHQTCEYRAAWPDSCGNWKAT